MQNRTLKAVGAIAIGLLLMGGLAWVLINERQAIEGAKSAYDRIESARKGEGDPGVLSPAKVRQIIGRTADYSKRENGILRETFVWKGVRHFTVYVSYTRSERPVLDKVSLMKPIK